MKVIGYIRVSKDTQDLEKQEHLLFQYAHTNQLLIDEIVRAAISSRRSTKDRQIEELLSTLQTGDTLLVAELSRLGRNMLETLNIINELSERGIKIVFIRQPELSTTGPHTKLLLAIYSYFAEAEREYISIRTKQGLAAARAKGKQLGRPKGSKNKERILDLHRGKILEYLQMGLNLASIRKLINPQLDKPISYTSFKYFVQHDAELMTIWQAQKESKAETVSG